MVREPSPELAAALLPTLRANSPSYLKSLRVLVVSTAPIEGFTRL